VFVAVCRHDEGGARDDAMGEKDQAHQG